ncbi:MAG TPA: hypothetical protein PK826_03345 [Anaerolineae bacterium]|nr:hypothetical protein [Ardenticatenia bacterium]HQZ70353.1 hypothetical protein [Anaerolineae bacterium]HRA19980.1 hypothetical protein [Anaerolineae bacterium]
MSESTWRVSNLVARADAVHAWLWQASRLDTSAVERQTTLDRSSERAAADVAIVKDIARERAVEVAHLPEPSRQAFGWLAWLARSADHPRRHVETLAGFRRAAERQGGSLCWAAIKPMKSLLRGKGRPPHFELLAHIVFVGAGDEVLSAVYERGRGQARPREVDLIDAYAGSPEALAVYGAVVDGLQPEPHVKARGRHQDLVAVFTRVNQTFFAGRLAQPSLNWSAEVSRRKLGHYRPMTDELQLSLALDRPDVPAEVLDFVMYHELLHKAIGVDTKDGRRRAHTAMFRLAEARYPHRDRVERWLRRHLG